MPKRVFSPSLGAAELKPCQRKILEELSQEKKKYRRPSLTLSGGSQGSTSEPLTQEVARHTFLISPRDVYPEESMQISVSAREIRRFRRRWRRLRLLRRRNKIFCAIGIQCDSVGNATELLMQIRLSVRWRMFEKKNKI